MAKPLERQRPVQGISPVQSLDPQQVSRLAAGGCVEKAPGNLGQSRCVARGNRLGKQPLCPGPVLKFVKLSPLAGHLADQTLGLDLQTAMDRNALVRLEEIVFRCFQNPTQVSNRLAETGLFDQRQRLRQPLQDRPISGQKDVFQELLVGRFLAVILIEQLDGNRNLGACRRELPDGDHQGCQQNACRQMHKNPFPKIHV